MNPATRRRPSFLYLTLAFLLSSAALATTSTAQTQEFILYNQTGVDIFYVYVSPSGVNDWEEDVLSEDVLLQGEGVRISFAREEGARYWDLMVQDEDENSLIWAELDLFRICTVTLYYDADEEIAWAETVEADAEGYCP